MLSAEEEVDLARCWRDRGDQEAADKLVTICASWRRPPWTTGATACRERWLVDEPSTLELLYMHYGVSRERVRQIEGHALQKLRKAIKHQNVFMAGPLAPQKENRSDAPLALPGLTVADPSSCHFGAEAV